MEQVNIGIIGSGLMGTLYARICSQLADVRVCAVADLHAERARAVAQELGAASYSDYNVMLHSHRELDAILVCTPEDRHVGPVMAALQAEKHLFVEKPLTTDVEQARMIVQAATNRPTVTMVGYSLRFDPRYVAIKEAIESGRVGRVLYMTARRDPSMASLERLKGRVELPFWVGVHDIDMMRWLTGSEVVGVFARATPGGFKQWNVKGAYFALLTFASGVVAVLENAWGETAAGRPQAYAFRVQGTEALVEVRSYEQGVIVHQSERSYAPDTVYSPVTYGMISGVYRDQIAYFIRCLREGHATDMPVLSGLQGVRVADAITRSAEKRTEISLDAAASESTT